MAVAIDQTFKPELDLQDTQRPGLPFSFDGRAGEYFGIWIVNILLSIVTLGIYSAWAKVRTKRYFYGNTKLDGSAFDYLASPIQILKGRLIAFAFFVAYALLTSIWPATLWIFLLAMFLIAPWAIVRARVFNAHYSSYRNVRFGFKGGIGEAFKIYVLLPIANVVTLGAALPFTAHRSDRFLTDNSSYGRTDMNFGGKLKAYTRIYGMTLLLAWPAILLAGAIAAFVVSASLATLDADPREVEQVLAEHIAAVNVFLAPYAAWLPSFIVLALVLAIVASSYLTVHRQNYLFNNTRIGPHELRLALSLPRILWIRFSNMLVIALSFGLMIPWAKIRMARYQIEQMSLAAHGDLDTLVGEQQAKAGAYGDEMGEGMDLDLGLGV